jgi:DUF4097 and DUF4098 domain-containing protein YvlB
MKKVLLIIVLLIAILGVCAASVGVAAFTLGPSISSIGPRVFSEANNFTAKDEFEKTYPVGTPAGLNIRNDLGSVTIQGTNDKQIHLLARKTAWGATQASADEKIKSIQVDITQDGDKLKVSIIPPKGLDTGMYSVDLKVEVPQETNVTVNNTTGDLSLANIQGNADLNNDFGDIEVSDLQKGSLEIESNNGSIEARQIDCGDQSMVVNSDFGSITLNKVSAYKLNIRSANGKLDLQEIKILDRVELKSDFGDINYNGGRAGSIQARSQNGSVSFESLSVEGDLIASSDFGQLNFEEVKAKKFDLKTQNTGITARGVSGVFKADNEFGDIEITRGDNMLLDLSTKNGSIKFEGALQTEGENKINSEFGGVTIRLPKDAAFKYDARTEFGDINTNLEGNVTKTEEEKHISGQNKTGGPLLTIRTTNGSITLEAQ